MHIYIRQSGKLHVITYEREYINIVSSCNLFLSDFEEMKSCIYRVETPKRWDGIVVVLASSVHIGA